MAAMAHPLTTGLRQPTADRWTVLAIMTLIYGLNVADRFLASILMEPIKHDFALSDTMVGFLTGTVLALFFVLTTYPAGILADRLNRKNLVLVFVVMFSAMTVGCGLAVNVMQFALARLGIGIAEAGTTPPSLSLLADKFTANQRGMAMTIFTIGAALGGAFGSGLGGFLNDRYGWRFAMIVFGLAGLPLIVAAMALVREPRRGVLDVAPSRSDLTVGKTLRFIWSQKALVHLIAGGTIVTFWGWGLLWWAPAFYHRSFAMSVSDAGRMLGSIHLIAGTASVLATVFIMKWLGGRDPRLQLGFLALLVLAGTFPSIIAFSTQSINTSTAMMWTFVPVAYLFFGPNFAMVNNLVPASMRGQAVAIYLLTTNFANLAIAPQLVGWTSDFLAAHGHDTAASLRVALVTLAVSGFWGGLHYALAMRHIRQDTARLRAFA